MTSMFITRPPEAGRTPARQAQRFMGWKVEPGRRAGRPGEWAA